MVIACHAESNNFIFYQDLQTKTKFWGKSMELTPDGTCHLLFPQHRDHFTWSKVTSCMRNIFSSAKYLEHYGEMQILNHTTGEMCIVTFKESRMFSSGRNEVSAAIKDATGNTVHALSGTWSDSLSLKVPGSEGDIGTERQIWRSNPAPQGNEEHYGFTLFAISLNELTSDMQPYLPTHDSRYRPDQRKLEEGNLDSAEAIKSKLEERQRQDRKAREDGNNPWVPQFFKSETDTLTNQPVWKYNGQYWPMRQRKAFQKLNLWEHT